MANVGPWQNDPKLRCLVEELRDHEPADVLALLVGLGVLEAPTVWHRHMDFMHPPECDDNCIVVYPRKRGRRALHMNPADDGRSGAGAKSAQEGGER